MLLQCLAVLSTIWGATLACKSKPPPPNRPPTITCPSVQPEYIADSGSTYTKVTWQSPLAKDPDGNLKSVSIKTGKGPGDTFGRGNHVVVYVATDNKGLTNMCFITFRVKVVECRRVFYIYNGRLTCGGNIYGKSCEFQCDEGYELVGSKYITCQKDAKWSDDTPQCVAKECPVLKVPDHGKSYVCTNDRKFGSICWLTCDEDKGYAPTRGQWTQCTKGQTWTNLQMTCEDVVPPFIENCPQQTIIQTKEPGSPQTEVTWPKITVTDNSGKNIIPTSTTGDVSPSVGIFPEGTHLVRFTAVDGNNNRAEPCFFIVRIQSVVCDPPSFEDKYLDTSDDCINFEQGASCKLKCPLAITLAGQKYITCKKAPGGGSKAIGYWDWGQHDSPPAEKHPYCEVHNCTELPSPDNGAIACDDWLMGEQCQLQCNDKYDIPEDARFTTNLYLCVRNTGQWNNEYVPNCVYREFGEKLSLPEYYYFRGDCNAAKELIKVNFLKAIETNKICPDEEFCTLDNVNVRCGDTPDDFFGFDVRRRKRATRPNYIKFNLIVNMVKEGDFGDSILRNMDMQMKPISRRIRRLTFRVGRRMIKAIGMRIKQPKPICRPGLKVGVIHRDSCVPCLRGSYHNLTRDECLACPRGQYQPDLGQMSCVQCPQGHTTVTIANTNSTDCQKMCRPGEYSKNGVVPCLPCTLGLYQSREGETSCTRCPVGTTTSSERAGSSAECVPFDILLQGPLSVPIEGTSPAKICDFTFAVWIKLTDTSYGGVKFEMYSPVTGVGVEVAISADVTVHIDREHSVHMSNVLDTKWTHVAVTWSDSSVKIFLDGRVAKKQTLSGAKKCPSPTQSAMRVILRDHAYLYLRDLNILTFAIRSLKRFSKTCNIYSQDSLFSLEELDVHASKRVNEVLPSTCLNPGVCSTQPCGKNICIPRLDNYTCACRGGYSGSKCEIAPDLCKDNICRNNATCLIKGTGYKCDCQPGFRGELCQDSIVDGGWGAWQEWGTCSKSCGNGTRIRHRFCNNPLPARGGKSCSGPKLQTKPCVQEECPDCSVSTLIVGKGIIPTCVSKGKSITCSVECELGKVFPEEPFNYTCSQGIWTPTRQTVSCTDPVSPITAGINYTVVFDSSLNKADQVASRLIQVGGSLACAQSGGCRTHAVSSVCSEHVSVCKKYNGDFYGSLIVQTRVPDGQIDIKKIQENERRSAYLSPLFATWDVFSHTSDEVVTPSHRALELNIRDNKTEVYPFSDPSLAVEVPGQFGTILKTWKEIDNTNWEVRSSNYTDFQVRLGRRKHDPNFLSARQVMTCPVGSVQGGVFCIKCPPGKMYVDGECRRCRHGFYQDVPGMTSCKACPGLQTTELLGSNDKNQCLVGRQSGLKMLLGLNRPGFGVFDVEKVSYRNISLQMSRGRVERLAFNPRDQYVYYATDDPPVIGRVRLDGSNDDVLAELQSGTIVSGLDVDAGSDLVFYTTYTGTLSALDVTTGAVYTLVSNLTFPRDLVLDQDLGVYLVESDSIVYLSYSGKVRRNVITDKDTVWNPVIYTQENKLYWQSYNNLRSAYLNGSSAQTLATQFTSRHGHTDDFYIHVHSSGRLVRLNKDLTAGVGVFSLPSSVVRMRMINTTDPAIKNMCSDKAGCQHGCFPVNSTIRTCFCAADFTLQNDLKTCRADYFKTLVTSDPKKWEKPVAADYSVPPSMTLRVRVKACHSARLALANSGRRLYKIELGQRRGNVTEMSIKKVSVRGTIVLDTEETDLLDCDTFRSFWIVWEDHFLRVGSGETVGKSRLMQARDNLPYDINFVMFGVGVNATAEWQI